MTGLLVKYRYVGKRCLGWFIITKYVCHVVFEIHILLIIVKKDLYYIFIYILTNLPILKCCTL